MTNVRKTAGSATQELPSRHVDLGLTHQEVLDVYRKMVLIRTIDDRVWTLNRQGKVPIAASCQGHEAAQVGSGLAALKDGACFLFPYYRDLALKFITGLSALEIMLGFMGKQGAPYSGGRQFPLQGADLERRVIQISNVVSASLTQAVGYALACKMLGEETVVLAYFGDGGSSEGECHEAMNFAGVRRLPVVFICENNRYAISVPLVKQMAIESLADRAAGYGFPGSVVDGMDLFDSLEATKEAIDHARNQGPVLLEMKVERYRPHTTDDDDRRYRSQEEVEEGRLRDPILSMRAYLMEAELLTGELDEQIHQEARAEVNAATDAAEAAPYPDASTVYDNLYHS